MNNRLKIKGKLRTYLQMPILLGLMLLAVNIWIYTISVQAGVVLSVFLAVYYVIIIMVIALARPGIMNELVSFATEYGQIQKALLKELELPHALLDDTGKVIWTNNSFDKVLTDESVNMKSIFSVFPELTKDDFPEDENPTNVELKYMDKDYRVSMKKVGLRDMALVSETLDPEKDYDGYLIAMYLFDETALNLALQEVDNQSLVVGLIYIDNYDEAVESVEGVGQSLIGAFIDRQINQYVAAIDGIIRKTEKDKYLLILRKSSFNQMKEDKFKLLDDIKSIDIGNATTVTLSIGVGIGGYTYAQNCEFARNAIDLALGRGGDQAVIKSIDNVVYFGGKSQQKESNARVKARVKAHALQEIITSKEKVFVMGHRDADVDSFGACVGIKAACESLQKECHIVLSSVSTSLKPLVDLYHTYPDLESNAVLTGDQALELVDGNSVLVVVDVNKPSITDCSDLIRRCKSIVVLDHHRQGTESIENATLAYVEPFASSACEMVAEILQYINNGVKLKSIIADCLYAGIVIDSQNFTAKTGVRTFEAAAFLRRNGADVTRIRKMFREDESSYKAKADAVRTAEVYRDDFAISYCESEDAANVTVLAAQAANELLNITGIKASFVFSEYQNKIYISARSIDEVNVQIIMERMGGGGHLNIAGAQLEETSVDEAMNMLKDTLDIMIEEEAI